jgi:hypothetical protein
MGRKDSIGASVHDLSPFDSSGFTTHKVCDQETRYHRRPFLSLKRQTVALARLFDHLVDAEVE